MGCVDANHLKRTSVLANLLHIWMRMGFVRIAQKTVTVLNKDAFLAILLRIDK